MCSMRDAIRRIRAGRPGPHQAPAPLRRVRPVRLALALGVRLGQSVEQVEHTLATAVGYEAVPDREDRSCPVQVARPLRPVQVCEHDEVCGDECGGYKQNVHAANYTKNRRRKSVEKIYKYPLAVIPPF